MNSIKQDIPSEFFNESAVAIYIISPDHKVIFWNKACEILTGITSPEIINTKNHWQPFYKEHRPCLVDIVIDGTYSRLPELYEKYGKSKLSPEGISAERWYQSLGGEKRYMIFDAVPVFNSSGEIVAAIETLHDSTDLKQIELKKEKMISELKNHISENMPLKVLFVFVHLARTYEKKMVSGRPLKNTLKIRSICNLVMGSVQNVPGSYIPPFFDKTRFK